MLGIVCELFILYYIIFEFNFKNLNKFVSSDNKEALTSLDNLNNNIAKIKSFAASNPMTVLIYLTIISLLSWPIVLYSLAIIIRYNIEKLKHKKN